MKYLVLILFCLVAAPVAAQSDWRQTVQDWIMNEDLDGTDVEQTMEELEAVAEHPINLNQMTRDQLEQLPFLSARQVEDIMAYVYRYGPVRSVNELTMVTSIDYHTRELLKHFVEAGEEVPKKVWPTLENVKKFGKHNVMLSGKIPCYERKGDKDGYLGYPYRHDLRYQFTYNNQIKFGLTAAQDAGEPFFSNDNKLGYDHYNYYFQLRDIGRLEEFNVGMYRVQMGMGLVMNTGFYLGKLASLQSMGRCSHVLTAHASRSSQNYLRGAAATVRLADSWHLTAFASYRPLDATLNSDGTARTIVTDGYHRTPTEMGKKNNTHLTDLGLRLSLTPSSGSTRRDISSAFSSSLTYLNLNLVYSHFNPSLFPQKSSDYRRYAQEGKNFCNASLDYGYTNAAISFSGETAVNADGALATLNVFSWRATEQVTLMALHRYYDKRYTAFHAQSFGEGSSTQNEHGLYVGSTWTPSRKFSLQGYVDYAHFPWKRYRVSDSSDALDALLFARVYINRCNFEGRYRFRIRQQDNDDKTFIQNRYEHRSRLLFRYTGLIGLQAQVDGAILSGQVNSRGIMVSQQFDWNYRWLQLHANVGWFRSDDYDSRLYQYERSVRYDFSFPAYYGHGVRYAFMASAKLRRLTLSAKVGVTDYFDRAVISSSYQQIDGSSQTDISLQAAYKF